ncbi:MAG: rhomboid family intramembrane serine protease [Planctomycetaceae bacterium]|nr:rhomboid family intramembrane serine protease [Planctomycetaceae bacterium]
MRQLGKLPDQATAHKLADFLLTLGISTKVDPDGDAWAVWVRQEEQLDEARREFAAFQAEPGAARYQQATAEANQLRRTEAQRDRAARRNQVELRNRWGGTVAGNTPVTWVLIGVSVFVAMQSGFGSTPPDALFMAELHEVGPGLYRWSLADHLRAGEFWRLVTPIFLHFGVIHLLFNMLWMYDLGRRTESLLGTGKYIAFVLIAAVLSNFAQYYFQDPSFGGMSGVVYALIGYAWVQYRYAGVMWLYLGPSGMFIAMLWLVMSMLNPASGVANWAHGAGLLVGVVLGGLPIVWRRR